MRYIKVKQKHTSIRRPCLLQNTTYTSTTVLLLLVVKRTSQWKS